MNWKEYQVQTAKAFQAVGCAAEVEKIVEGVRGTHEIDVYVSFQQYGVRCTWVVECKYWKSNVTKDKVITLQGIVDDIGADRGILISKTGFQSGAIKASRNSCITLTSLEDLIDDLGESATKRAIETLHIKLTRTKHRLYSLRKTIKTGKNSFSSSFPDYIDGKAAMHYFGTLCIIETGFENIKLGKKSYPCDFDDSTNKIVTTDSIEEYLGKVQLHVETFEQWLNANTN